jgi:hypothetical protein
MIDILGYVLVLYVAVTMGFVGFGMMIGGPRQAKSVMRYFYLRPLYWAGRRTRSLAFAVLAMTWRIVLVYVLRPLWRGVVRLFRRPAPRQPGWFRKWVWPS